MNEEEEIYVSERLAEEKRAELVMYEAGGVDEEVAVEPVGALAKKSRVATQNSSYCATNLSKLIYGPSTVQRCQGSCRRRKGLKIRRRLTPPDTTHSPDRKSVV